MALVPETRELFGSMTVEDNLVLGGFRTTAARARAEPLDEVYARFPRLEERRQQTGRHAVGRRAADAGHGPRADGPPALLMLDEPSLGLAPLVVREIFSIIVALRATGVTILLVEQNARAALEVADYGYVLEMGEIALEGRPPSLPRDPRVIETYLGLGTST